MGAAFLVCKKRRRNVEGDCEIFNQNLSFTQNMVSLVWALLLKEILDKVQTDGGQADKYTKRLETHSKTQNGP